MAIAFQNISLLDGTVEALTGLKLGATGIALCVS